MSKVWSWFLLAVWVFTLFGNAIPWSWRAAIMAVPVCIVLAGAVYRLDDVHFRPPGFAAFVGWFVLFIVQCLPLPPAVLAYISPGSYHLYSETVWVLQPGTWMPLALNAEKVFLGIMQLWVVGGVFFITTRIGADHNETRLLLQRLSLAAGAIATCVLILYLGTVIGPLQWHIPRGAIVSLAALMPLVTACHLYAKPHQNYGKWIERFLQGLRHPLGHLHGYLLVSAFMMGIVVVVTGPPKIQLALVGGMLVMTAMLLFRRGSRSSCTAAVVLSLFLLVIVGLGTRHFRHAESLPVAEPASVRVDSQTLLRDFLLLGAGPGNLPDLRLRYSQLSVDPGSSSDNGLPMVSEGGLGGIVLTLWFWSAVIIAGIFGWLKRRNRISMYLLPGILAGLIVCFAAGPDTHHLFGLWPEFPGYFLAALWVAVACYSSTGDPDSSIGVLTPKERWLIIFLTCVVGLTGAVYTVGKIGLSVYKPLESSLSSTSAGPGSVDFSNILEKHLLLDPLSGANWYAAGGFWAAQREDEKALACFNRGVRLNPLAGEPIYRLGQFLEGKGHAEEGQVLMRTGLQNAPLSKELRRDYLLFLLTKGANKDALRALPGLLLLAPEQTSFWLRYFESQDISGGRWLDLLPERAEVYRQYGDYLAERQHNQTADTVYQKAVQLAVAEPWVSGELFLDIAGYFVDGGRLESALEVLRAGMESHPTDLTLLLTAASVYQRMGITYRAEELYRKALLLDPDNREVLLKLDNL
jgi:tetratricopeptide (TPR) repeat protein